MQKVGHRPIAVVQTAFIKGIMKLDNFGISYYSSNVSGKCLNNINLFIMID